MKSESVPTIDIPERVRTVVAVAQEHKAVDLRVLYLAAVSDFTDYFLVCSGTNQRQVQSIAKAIEDRLRDLKIRPLHIEGLSRGKWILMDYGGFVVHVFDDETRQFYRLERLWSDAPDETQEFGE